MRNPRFCLLIFALSILPATSGLAGSSEAGNRALLPSQEMNFTLEGKISKQAPGKLTISGEGNIIFHVTYNDKTEIKRKDGSAGSAKDLRVGITVRVEGALTEAGEVVAQKIEVHSDDAPKGTSTGF